MSVAYKYELPHSVETPDLKWSPVKMEGAIELPSYERMKKRGMGTIVIL
jgi:hypothetical protein